MKFIQGTNRSQISLFPVSLDEAIDPESIYRRRQAIVEHPYGIIKRQWGFYYISTKKGIEHAASDVGLMFVAFNLRRLFNILGKSRLEALLARFDAILVTILAFIDLFKRKRTYLKHLIIFLPYPLKKFIRRLIGNIFENERRFLDELTL